MLVRACDVHYTLLDYILMFLCVDRRQQNNYFRDGEKMNRVKKNDTLL